MLLPSCLCVDPSDRLSLISSPSSPPLSFEFESVSFARSVLQNRCGLDGTHQTNLFAQYDRLANGRRRQRSRCELRMHMQHTDRCLLSWSCRVHAGLALHRSSPLSGKHQSLPRLAQQLDLRRLRHHQHRQRRGTTGRISGGGCSGRIVI